MTISKAGMDPGTLVYIGEPKTARVQIDLIHYTAEHVQEAKDIALNDIQTSLKSEGVNWLCISGVHDAELIHEIGNQFNIHPLVLEDIMNTSGRPKFELENNCVFICGKMMEPVQNRGVLPEQFSIIISGNTLLLFQQDIGDTFDQLRDRIRAGRGKIRLKGAEYLCYLILDNIVDNFISYSQILLREIEELELDVLNRAKPVVLNHIVRMKKRVMNFKRSIDPLKEAIGRMQSDMSNDNKKYYRDLYDHIVLESENIAMYRETLINLLSLYHSQLGQKTNDTMRTLTVISSIFVPLTFIAGVYGMNFKNMPELEWHYGYFYALGLMGIVGVGMFIFSIRKKWL
jgi:magnesium transporter